MPKAVVLVVLLIVVMLMMMMIVVGLKMTREKVLLERRAQVERAVYRMIIMMMTLKYVCIADTKAQKKSC